ncbi:hypothetical protein B0A55_05956 [Friedmanniomyces simplex]|uniref:GP-PDE domain-containing protein n=1 Tax=Friedmanniomyces simplex TaxID=329884 RepID=A0A4U0XD89_9PEZI|nr:hypothetical protein B0A55_05956 [Friedmanniomyces simplex]
MATTNPEKLPGPPVEANEAQGAQVPLQSFNIPEFPAQARGLKALTLTSDIKVDEYQTYLSQPYSVPTSLPIGVESLTLELFSLGYPPGFLTALASRLPNLKSVVIYSQLFAGITKESQDDAVEFFKRVPFLRALHLLDVFAKPGFFIEAGKWLKYNTSDTPGEARRGLMFLEVNYSFRHEDEDFMAKIQATELPSLIGPGLISSSFNISTPETAEEDEEDPTTIQQVGDKQGVMAFNKTLAPDVVFALTDEAFSPKGLRALNITLYTLTPSQLTTVLKVQKNVMVLSVTVETEPGEDCKKELLKALAQCKDLEQVEVIANPSLQFFMALQNPRSGVLAKSFPSAEEMTALNEKCPKLNSFKANVLRTNSFGTVEFERKDGKWTGGVTEGKLILWYLTLLLTAGVTITMMFSVVLGILAPLHDVYVQAARQPYDVHKIIDAFRNPHDDLKLLCAHRGLRWNGTSENSRDSYFRASEAGIECIETDIHLSLDGQLPMIHDRGLGRTTDIGEMTGQAAYNPYTAQGYNPKVASFNFTGLGGVEQLHLRDEQGRVRDEYVPSLPQMVESIFDSGMNVVLELDFKDQTAIEPAYWALKHLTNRAGVPANEWCIYKLQSVWYQTPEIFEALPWVQDAFRSGIQLAFIPVYDPKYVDKFDQLASAKLFSQTNYTISLEVGLRNVGGPIQDVLDFTRDPNSPVRTAGTFFAPGDFTYPNMDNLTFFDTANYSLPADLSVNNSVFTFKQNKAPMLLDAQVGDGSSDGHDYRSDFHWILEQGYEWIITDTADEWHSRLQRQGLRNISRLIADGERVVDGAVARTWYRRFVREVGFA